MAEFATGHVTRHITLLGGDEFLNINLLWPFSAQFILMKYYLPWTIGQCILAYI